jgi:predicted permease
MAVRSALGADRRRLLAQLTVEGLVLALFGGALGTALAFLLTRLVAGTSAVSIPMLRAVSVDGTALLFTLAVTLLAGLLLGVVPALQLDARGAAATMREDSRGSTEGRRGAFVREGLVVAEVALACVLLVGMGLLLRSFLRVLDVDLGFEPGGVVMWQVESSRSFDEDAARVAFFENLVARVQMVPGVEQAGLTDTPPLGRNRSWNVLARGVTYERGTAPVAFPRVVDSRYLQVMRIPLLAGRQLTTEDDVDAPLAVVLNETAARTLFPGQDPIGQVALIPSPRGMAEWRVVGVVGDVRHQSLEQGSGLEVYLPYAQTPYLGTLALVVRSTRPATALIAGVREALREVDAAMPTSDYQLFDAVVDRAVSPRRFILVLIGGFALAALLLAAVGIYAVLSYSVSQRIPEIGIRMALGETAGAVRRRVVGRTMILAGAGIVIGAALSFGLARLIGSLLYEVGTTDPLTFAGMAAVLLLVAGLAAYLPARRASGTDPLVALRAGQG